MSENFDKSYWNFVQMKFKGNYNFVALLPVLNKHMKWIKRYVDGQIRVLDIGFGFGYFLKLCDKSCWETYGVDISSHAINIARKNTKAKLYLHNIENVKKRLFEENYFDLITMFEVIEHLTLPSTVLKEIYRILNYRGKLVVTTPNLNAAERIIMKILTKENMWHGFFDETHVSLFTPFSLKSLVKRIGFRILELKTPFHLFPIAVSEILEKTFLGGQIWLLAEKT